MEENHILRAEGLKKTYKGRVVVNDVSITLKTGEIVGLLGPNGAGKTTTFYMIVGMIQGESGKIYLDDREITGLPMYMRARMGISYLPQEPSIFRRLSVRDNIKAILEVKGYGNKEIEEEVERILEEFRLKEFADRKGMSLSGGERRRTEIARTIATRPTFILFDEPFAGIDPIAIIELKKMMNYLRTRGIGMLITDHNVRDTLSITDRTYIINNGEILDEGTPERLLKNREVIETYLGEEFTI
ncbi:MAG TPA: LPS export ABC transporter ATP-binding protein [Nitrospirae bacterium]|nr:LPS export ABC transporter ATP-binding protein [Nitrospirota bacterium]